MQPTTEEVGNKLDFKFFEFFFWNFDYAIVFVLPSNQGNLIDVFKYLKKKTKRVD